MAAPAVVGDGDARHRRLRQLWLGPVPAIADQGALAGANFVLSLTLARHLPADAYGAFTAGYSCYLLLAAIYSSFITEPFTVFAARRWRGGLDTYLRSLLRLHALVLVPLAATVAALVAAGWGRVPRAICLAALVAAACAAVQPALQLLRSAQYVRGRPWRAAAGTGAYAVAQLAVLGVLCRTQAIDLRSAVTSSVVASAIGITTLAIACRWRTAPARTIRPTADVVRSHLRFGRGAIGATLSGWICGNAGYAAMGWAAGASGIASLRSLDILLLPFMHAATAIGLLYLPRCARMADDPLRVRRACLVLAGLGTIAAVAAIAVLWFAGPAILHVIAPAVADEASRWEPIYALGLLACPLATASAVGLRALARTDLLLVQAIIAASVMLAGDLVSLRFGLGGIVRSIVLGEAVGAGVGLVALVRATHRPVPDQASLPSTVVA